MTRAEFVEWLKDEVTLSGALQINLPDKEYERIIDRELKIMYEINSEAQIDSYCVIPVQVFYTPEFRQNRIIKFPDCVLTVGKFYEMKQRNSMFGIADPDFGFNKAFQADMWLGSMMNMDSVAFRTIQWSVWDQLKKFTLVDIQHRWNYVKHELLVLGHDPRVNVFCTLKVKADEQELFENALVQKWIAAHCKLQAAKLLTLFTTSLVGGVTINMSTYTEEANKDIDFCKEKFTENAGAPHMYTIH